MPLNSAQDNRVARNFVDVRKQVESRDWKNRGRYNNLRPYEKHVGKQLAYPKDTNRPTEETTTMRMWLI